MVADMTKAEDIQRFVSKTAEHFGRLDIVVNNALGDLIGFMQPPMKVTMAQWDMAFGVQARAFLLVVRETASLMRDGGRIIAISYWPGSHGGGLLPYFAMGTNKAALEAMCRHPTRRATRYRPTREQTPRSTRASTAMRASRPMSAPISFPQRTRRRTCRTLPFRPTRATLAHARTTASARRASRTAIRRRVPAFQ